jgi:phosphatidylserine/phosphatidylglycerophosphate/cardiolipin synthase-like enzyme
MSPILPPGAMRTLAAQSGTPEAADGPVDLFTAAGMSKLTGGPSDSVESASPPEAMAEVAEVLEKTGADLSALKQQRKALRIQLKEAREGPLKDQARLSVTLQQTQGQLKAVEQARREKTWSKIKGDRQVSSTYESYFTTGRTPIKEMGEVLKVAGELADPNSPRRLKGNSIEVLTRGEVWEKKMHLMEQAASNPKGARVDAEYFELSSPEALEKLTRAARGGANVRVLVDSGRLQPDGENLDATTLASRLSTVKSMENGSRGKAGVQFFANQEVLGSRGDLMHRKLLRVNDTVLFGGMNANSGSGENVDNGMLMEGPAARNQAEGFQRDLDRSVGRNAEQIFGTQLKDLREKENITVSSVGLLSLLEASGTQLQKPGKRYPERVDAAIESAGFQGVKAGDLANIPDSDGDGKVTDADVRAFLVKGEGSVQLTERGRKFLADGLEAAVDRMNSKDRKDKLTPGELPSDKKVGTDTVAVGDTSAERTALMLHTIDTAEKRIDVSAFVVTEEIARALVEKKKRMGDDFKVRVVLDPGMYGYGGTPNEKGYRYLEDQGIPVKWAVLDRSNPEHDRKVHAKLMVTDKMMLTGSTNFSSKALRSNWELSDVVYFGDDDKSKAKQDELHQDFDKLWSKEALSLNSSAIAEKKYAGRAAGPEKDLLIDRERGRSLRSFLRGIENYERGIGNKVQEEVRSRPELQFNLEQHVQQGEARGYAMFDLIGDERMQEMRNSIPSYQKLLKMSQVGSE